MLLFKHRKPRPDRRLQELLVDMDRTRIDLSVAYCQFNLVSDPEMVESCIYQIDALKARYNYLIRSIKAHYRDCQETQPAAVAATAIEGRKLV